MVGSARHLPRHLHRRLLSAMVQQASWFTVEALLTSLGPTLQRFRRREVVCFLTELVRLRLLLVDGQRNRLYRRPFDEDWLGRCRAVLGDEEPLREDIPS